MNTLFYDRPSFAMLARARDLLEFALFNPVTAMEFQDKLDIACEAETITFEDAMMFAHAATMAADCPGLSHLDVYYRERAAILFRRAYDVIILEREARTAADAGLALQ